MVFGGLNMVCTFFDMIVLNNEHLETVIYIMHYRCDLSQTLA